MSNANVFQTLLPAVNSVASNYTKKYDGMKTSRGFELLATCAQEKNKP